MKQAFTAIDFETATSKHSSICQIGLVRVENSKIIHEFSALIRPPENEYGKINSRIHGITASETANEKSFDKIWHLIEPYITGQHVVAHNAAFDISCLRQTLAFYNLSFPTFTQHCTYKIYNAKLKDLCKRFNIPLKHHDALSDAKACAELFKRH